MAERLLIAVVIVVAFTCEVLDVTSKIIYDVFHSAG